MAPITKTQRSLLFLAITLSIVTAVVLYLSIFAPQNDNDTVVQNSDSPVDAIIAPKSVNSDIEGMDTLNAQLDTALQSDSLDDESRVKLLLNKGYLATAVRSSSEISASINVAMEQFGQVLDILEKNPDLRAKYIVNAKFGFLYNFAANCFARSVTVEIPTTYGTYDEYTRALPKYDKSSALIIAQYQKAAFQSMVEFIYNDPDLKNTSDKSVISHRMFVTAIYLSSYFSTLTTEEKNDLRTKIGDDMQRYNLASFNIFAWEGRPYHLMGEISSSFHYAFAHDIYTSYRDDYTLTKEDNMIIDSYYQIFNNALDTSPSTDKVSVAMVGLHNGGYQLSSLQRRYGGSEEGTVLYEKAISSFKKHVFAFPEVSDIAKGSFNYTLSSDGAWAKEKNRIFTLAEINPEVKNILTSIGVKL